MQLTLLVSIKTLFLELTIGQHQNIVPAVDSIGQHQNIISDVDSYWSASNIIPDVDSIGQH